VADPILRFLVETELHLRNRVEPEALAETIAETEQHLRERLAAFQELGWDENKAAEHAVSDFGPADAFAFSILEAHSPSQGVLNRKVVGWAGATLAAFALCIFLFLLVWTTFPYVIFLPFVPLLFLFLASVRSRRPVPVRLTALLIAWCLAYWVVSPLAWLNLNPYGGAGSMPAWEVGPYMAQARRLLPNMKKQFHRYQVARKLFLAKGSEPVSIAKGLGFYEGKQITVPTFTVGLNGEPSFGFIAVPPSDAIATWRNQGGDAISRLGQDISWREATMGAVSSAEEVAYLQQLRDEWNDALDLTKDGWLFIVGANLAGCFCGSLLYNRRRRRLGRIVSGGARLI
jgi:hypothetical protein